MALVESGPEGSRWEVNHPFMVPVMSNMTCIKDYLVKTFPKDILVKKGEVVEVLGYLMGRDIVLQLDPVLHPPAYKHLTHESFCVFDKEVLDAHFQEVT
jgi:hypothetical protein